MLVIPDDIKELFLQNNVNSETRRKWKLRFFDSEAQFLYPEDILFPSDDLFPVDQEPMLVVENDQILTESLVLTESLCESKDLTFGECCSAQFEITLADILQDLNGKEFVLTVEVGDYEMSMGVFKVDSFVRQADRRMRKITAYDRMQKFKVDVASWYQGLTFPLTLREFRQSLCSYVGIQQVLTTLPLDDMTVTKTIDPEKLSGLDVIQAICEINGCFGHVDKAGRLKYHFLPQSGVFPAETLFPKEDLFPSDIRDGDSETISYYKQSETTYEDYIVAGIERLQIRQEEGDVGVTYGEPGNCYVIEGNFLAYGKSSSELLQIAATIFENISARIYRPCKIVAPALPWVEVGDGLICYTTDDVIETYCFKRTLKGIQSTIDTYEATGNIEQEENFGLSSQIIQLEGKTAVIQKTVEVVSVGLTDLRNYAESQFSVTAEQISAEVSRAKEAEEELESSIKVTAEAIDLKVSKGEVSTQLSLENDKVSIKGNRLIVDSTNFKLDETGNAIFSGSIAGGTINIADVFTVDSNGHVKATGNNLSWTSTNSSMTTDGTLTCKNIKVENGKFSGEIEGGTISANTEIKSGIKLSGVYIEGGIIVCQVFEADEADILYLSCGVLNQYSDRKLKNNIVDINAEQAVQFLNELKPVSFDFIKDGTSGLGFIAQDVKDAQESLGIDWNVVNKIKQGGDEIYAIPYMNYVSILVSAFQSMDKRIRRMEGLT